MKRQRTKGWRAVAAGWLCAILVALPAVAQVSDEDLRRAQADYERLKEESADLARQYQAAWAAEAELQSQIDILQITIIELGINLRVLRDQVRERAVELYMDNATAGNLASLLISASPSDLDTRVEYLNDIRRNDQVMVNGLELLNRQLQGRTGELNRQREEQAAMLVRLEEVAIDLNQRLEEGQRTYELLQQRREEERARQEAEEERARQEAEERARQEAEARAEAEAQAATTTSTLPPEATTTSTTSSATTTTTSEPATTSTATTTEPSTTTTTAPIVVTDTTLAPATVPPQSEPEDEPGPEEATMVCPVDGFHTFTDTWGAPRSGGRQHEGVDFLAARGTRVVAVEGGLVERMRNGGLGGITVWLRSHDGDSYYYAHLDAWAPGLSAGQEVAVGEPLGVVGTTGNSPEHIPHLHWEFHPGGYVPGGNSAINPTPLARQLCD